RAAQVHARVEIGNLLGVAVERERRAPAELAETPLGRLAPARMINRRVHVRIETVLTRRGQIPRGGRLLIGETDLHDRLDALEAVLPGNDEAKWRAVLVREHFAVEADCEDREGMHRLVEAQPL